MIWRKITLVADENSHGLGARPESRNNKKNGFFPRRFRVKEPRHSETLFAKKWYTSIVARL